MLKSLIKHSLRAFKRQKAYLIINIIGLTIGIVSSVLISLFVVHELTYDNFNENKDRLYRINLLANIGGQGGNIWATASVTGPTVAEEFPEVEAFMRIAPAGGSVIKIDNTSFVEDYRIEADSTFFDFFTVPLLRGDSKTVLNAPYTAVLSETAANKYYGDENPVGKTFTIGGDTTLFTVTGLMEDIPDNCHFRADMITSFMTNPGSRNPIWMSNNRATYVLLNENADPEMVNEKFRDLLEKYIGPEVQQFIGISLQEFEDQGNEYGYYLQPLRKIHLDPSVENLFAPPKDPKTLYIFASIALLIIIIACINYMNLSTAQASKRAREVGIKKLSGSTKGELIRQFLTESVFLALISLVLSIIIIEVVLPYFNDLLELELDLNYFNSALIIPGLLVLAILIGLLSGLYPAFFLSGFKPITVLKGSFQTSRTSVFLRKALVVFQFSVSIMLIVGSIIMFRQVNYMLKKDLGFNKEQLMSITRAGVIGSQAEAFKEEVKNIPGVTSVSFSTTVPGRNNNNNGYMLDSKPEETLLMFTNWADYDFIETFEMELNEGRYFEIDRGTDQQACVVNQKAIDEFLIDDPFNQRIMVPGESAEGFVYSPIVGIVKDFHHESLHQPVDPYIIRFQTENRRFGFVTLRVGTENLQETINSVEKVWKDFSGNDPLQYFFIDEEFDRLHRAEKQSSQLALVFSILAILIATLGLFGMTSYSLAQRTREIGVRRTMGASVSDIYILISKEITILVGMATVLSWTIIYFYTKDWLENFYYRICINPLDFFLGFLIALIIAVLTISYRTIKAARTNPAVSLKYE